MKSTTVFAALSLAAAAVLSPFAAHSQKAERQHLVIQVSDNDPGKWSLALNNAENVQQALGKGNVDIEIVAYGPGLNMLKSEKIAARLNAALDSNVELLACATTMRAMKVTKDDLVAGSKVIPAGVIHIMQRQRAGWSYIKI